MKRSDTHTLAGALDLLARDIQSPDDVPALCLREAAERLRELAPCQIGWANSIVTEQRALRELAEARALLTEAEDILADLASGYWQGVLGMAGPPPAPDERPIGERILDYWRNVEKTAPDFQQDTPAEPPHSGEKLSKEPPVSSKP